MKKKTGIALLGVLVFCSWTFQPGTELQTAEWLIGTWKNTTPRGVIYETWTKKSDLELAGKSYMLKKQDTVVFETIRLVREEEQLFYIPTVGNQNNGAPVRFALKASSDKELVFENPEHDFPQVISYTKITDDSLVAEISGYKNGQLRKQSFPMSRMKQN